MLSRLPRSKIAAMLVSILPCNGLLVLSRHSNVVEVMRYSSLVYSIYSSVLSASTHLSFSTVKDVSSLLVLVSFLWNQDVQCLGTLL